MKFNMFFLNEPCSAFIENSRCLNETCFPFLNTASIDVKFGLNNWTLKPLCVLFQVFLESVAVLEEELTKLKSMYEHELDQAR